MIARGQLERDQHAFSRISVGKAYLPGSWKVALSDGDARSGITMARRLSVSCIWLALACVFVSAPLAANETAEPSPTDLIEGLLSGRAPVGGPVRTHRSDRPSPHRCGFSGQARRALFRLYVFAPTCAQRASIDLARARQARWYRHDGTALVHHRRSGTRHAGAACRFCLVVSPAIDRPDRLACRDP